jgi:isopropylmalate/homocitrate/citramalate synthase
LEFNVPTYYPLVGENFNVTRAGIHADGLIKNEEVYLPFDTKAILGCAPSVAITKTSGLSGLVFWINNHYELSDKNKVKKSDPEIKSIYDWVMDKYDKGRIIPISEVELRKLVRKYLPDLIKKITEGRTS